MADQRYEIPFDLDINQDYDLTFDVEMDGGTSASTAEAWAVGQRNGTDVSESDPTYQNNAKYYADRAARDRESASGSSQTAVQAIIEARNAVTAAENAAKKAEDAAEEAAETVVAAQGEGICYIDPDGHLFIYEEEGDA